MNIENLIKVALEELERNFGNGDGGIRGQEFIVQIFVKHYMKEAHALGKKEQMGEEQVEGEKTI